MNRSKALLSMGALVALLAFALAGGAANAAAPRQAPTPGKATTPDTNPHPARFIGRVNSVSGSSLMLTTRQGAVTANVSSSTWILVERDGRCVEGQLSDIQTNRPAAVAGMT